MRYILAAAVALITFAVFLPALRNDFVNWDDGAFVIENYHIRLLNPAFFRWAFTDINLDYWAPVAKISHAVDYALWGLNPLGHHLSSIVFHAANAFVVVVLVLRLLEQSNVVRTRSGQMPTLDERSMLITAGVTGTLFGLHPLHVESVAWVSERKDLLCAFFFLLSILTHSTYAVDRAGGKNHKGHKTVLLNRQYLLSLAFFVLALASKPMAVSLPVVLLIMDWYPFRRIPSLKDLGPIVMEKLPFIVSSLGISALTFFAQKSLGAVIPMENIPLLTRVLVAAQTVFTYLWKMAVPVNLSPYYPFPEHVSFLSFEYLSITILVCGITMACILLAQRLGFLLAIWGYYMITLLPVIGIVSVGSVIMADRFTYLPSLGPFLLAGLTISAGWVRAGTSAQWGRLFRAIMVSVSICLISALSFLSVKQIAFWKNSLDLWSPVIEAYPLKASLAYVNRGWFYREKGQFDRAMDDYEAAISLSPNDAVAYTGRGLVFKKAGQLDRALADFSRAIELLPTEHTAYTNRGWVYMEKRQYDRAIEDFSAAITRNAAYADAYAGRGISFRQKGRYDRAIEDLTQAIDLHFPSASLAYINRGIAYKEMGQFGHAIEDYTKAVALNPSSVEAFNNRGVAFKHMGQLERAIKDLSKAIELDPTFYLAYFNRGMALETTGRVSEAIADFTEALGLKPDLVKAYLERGDLYRETGDKERAMRDFREACELGDAAGCDAMHTFGKR